MLAWVRWLLKRAALVALIALVTFLGMRAWDSRRGLPLEVWHTHVPDDVTAEEIARAGLGGLPRRRAGRLRRGPNRGHPEARAR